MVKPQSHILDFTVIPSGSRSMCGYKSTKITRKLEPIKNWSLHMSHATRFVLVYGTKRKKTKRNHHDLFAMPGQFICRSSMCFISVNLV